MGGHGGREGEKEGRAWGSGRGMPMRHICVWKGRGGTYRIVDNHMMLGHDAEHHDPNMAMTASKTAGVPDLIYFKGR